jgi:hypothetical protein
MSTNDKTPRQTMLKEHLERLVRAKRDAELHLQKAIADLLAFEVVLHKPIVLNDWPGHTQKRLRTALVKLEAEHVPSHD